MSTKIKKNLIGATVLLMIFLAGSRAFSRTIEIKMKLDAETAEISVEGNLPEDLPAPNDWFFLRTYADAEDLGERIKEFGLFDGNGNEVPYKKFAAGEFVAERAARRFRCKMNLRPLGKTIANAHVSWISKTHGLLMLNDLLPHFDGGGLKISFELPAGWKLSTNEEKAADGSFSVGDAETAVFLAGAGLRTDEITVGRAVLNLTILGEWQFGDKLAAEMAGDIFAEYENLFGESPVKKASIYLLPFPDDIGLDRWRAETRGSNVVILSTRLIAESFARQRLHEQLRHEIFHLWIPNALNLTGDYAWFYEGFAVYQALRTGFWLGQIRFEDFLNTLEQANFLEQKRSGGISLIDSSKMRWNGDPGSVYAKGLLAAFLCDAALLEKSRGKRDLGDVFRKIYRRHRETNAQDANTAVLGVLREYPELGPVIGQYIVGTEKIDWTKSLAVFGIENRGNKINADLRVKEKLSGREKALLKKLGYNRRPEFERSNINRNVN